MVKIKDTPTTPPAAREIACARIAPVWPLDEFIAVNPWWGLTDEPLPRAAARLAVLGGITPLMPRHHYRDQLQDRTDRDELLAEALAETADSPVSAARARAWLEEDPEPEIPRLLLATDHLDASRDLQHEISWKHCVVHQISQFCAARFDRGQSFWQSDRDTPLYEAWRGLIEHDRGIGLISGARELPALFRSLPTQAADVFVHARRQLDIREEDRAAHMHALLLSVNGWASWCSSRKWKAQQEGLEDDTLEQLLAIRLAWDLVLHRMAEKNGRSRPPSTQPPVDEMITTAESLQAPGWVWQRVTELAYAKELRDKLSRPNDPATTDSQAEEDPVEMQAYFCIDVRSEVYRRALEAISPQIETGGFAGFFGLPIAYRPLGLNDASARLPGLLAPSLNATDVSDQGAAAAETLGRRRQNRLAGKALNRRLSATGTSAFPVVEATGLTGGWKLVTDSCGRPPLPPARAGLSEKEAASLQPRLEWPDTGDTSAAKVALANRVLRAMSRTRDFAPLVLLIGHGAQSDNNPHQAGLDCGACCGHAGDVNARALADLLNEPEVREGLVKEGITIPDTTRFIPGLHNTTTDEVTLFDTAQGPAALKPRLLQVEQWLAEASARTREERAGRLSFEPPSPASGGLLNLLRRRARDWSQTRPEWALANNACFIAAPRRRTRGLDLDGRSFLHDYTWQEDPDFSVLELILTAPVVVAHWINFQYYASTVDNPRYGSGNKLLHNVVGGSLGVFEGNGGDLRIGLPLQSLHDGTEWRHEPLRLHVVVEAPAEAIDQVAANHPTLRNLLANRWLFLSRLDSESNTISEWTPDGWKDA